MCFINFVQTKSNIMDTFLEILKYILPSIIVFITAYFVIRSIFENEQKNKHAELGKDDRTVLLPLRLQAYERLVLLLERISPGQVIMRVHHPGMAPYQLQAAILQNVREEFEHNLAQQIYISPETWNQVKVAKEEILRLVNTSAAELKDDNATPELAKIILENWSKLEKNPVQQAIDMLKNEVKQLF